MGPEKRTWQNIGIVILSGLVSLMFLAAGGSKLLNPKTHIESFARWGYPDGFLYVTGLVEVLGAILVLIPAFRYYGALLLTCTMLAAFFTHMQAGEIGALPVPLVIGAFTGLLAWVSRLSKRVSTIE